MADCIFCRIVAGKARAEIVHEDSVTLAFLDVHPSSQGHTMVIPRFHASTLDGLPDDQVGPLFLAVKTVMGLLEKSLCPAGLNVGWNNGWAAGQRVPHLHVHLVPRYAGDEGTGVQFVARSPVHEDLARIATLIRSVR